MKIEIGKERPENFNETWDNQYLIFSHLEFACGIPHILYAVTTYKENGKPNVNFNSWSSFGGDGGGYFAVMPGFLQESHAYKDIIRTGEFCINFLPAEHYDNLIDTITKNDYEADEFAVGSFTEEKASLINAPRIKESFLSLECKLHSTSDLSNMGVSSLVVGEVINVVIDEEYAKGIDKKYTEDGFMFNIHAPKNMFANEDNISSIATCNIVRAIK